MTDIRLYLVELENNKKDEATRIATRTASRLQSKELRLVEIIESLGEYLNNEAPLTRERSMAFLAEVIAATPNGVLPLQHRILLLDFVIARISDREIGIGSCAKSLLALEERGSWDQGQVTKVIEALLEHTHPLIQCGSQIQRYPTLLLVDLLMAKYRTDLLKIHETEPNFLPRFISYFDGEKDPRNLMIIFGILNVVMTEWDASSCVQDLFDAAFNYFPITFRPPPDDTYKITAQDLKDRLRKCLVSTPAFAPYAFPALLDKLDSTSLNTKRDVLQTLHSIVQSYGPRTIGLYAVTLWDSVKFEILQAQEDDLAQESLNILAAMAVTLSQGSSDGLLTLLKPVIKECNEHLEDAPTKQSEAANRMLFVIASGSWEASNLAITGVLPHLFTLYQSTEDMPKRRSLIQTLSKLIEASCQSFGDWTTSPYQLQMKDNANSVRFGLASENALHKFSKQALEILIYGLSSVRVEDVSYRLALLQASQQLVRAREILNDSEISQIIRLLNNIILEEEPYGKDEVRITATTTLDEIARQKPHLIIEQSFPSFLSKIPDSDIGHDGKHIPILEAFAKIGVENKIFNTVVVRLKNKLNTAIHNSASSDYIQAILSALLYTVSNTTTSLVGSDTACPFYDDLVLPLLRQIPSSLQPDQQHDMVFGLMGCICNEILRQQSSNFQSTISQIIYNRSVGRSEDEGLPDPNMSRAEGRYLIISTSLLAAFRRDVPLPYSTSTLLTRLIQVTKVENLTPGSRAAAIQQIGLLVNKFLSISELKSVLAPKIEELKLDPSSIPVVFAILKALVFRNAPLLSSIFPSLVKRLSDEKSGPSIAHGFSTLLQPDEILTKENHCIISPLHKQKAFAMLVPDIAQGVRQTQPEQKMNYLVALSGILQWLPFTIIEPEISSLSPLLLQTLDITGEYDIKIGTIEMLNLILKEKGQELEEHISSIVTRLLNLASSYNNPPRIRGNALQCLALLPAKLRLEVVIPYRKQVVKKLTDAVDDRRRTVRAEAVRCRTKWIELDDVGSGNQDEDD